MAEKRSRTRNVLLLCLSIILGIIGGCRLQRVALERAFRIDEESLRLKIDRERLIGSDADTVKRFLDRERIAHTEYMTRVATDASGHQAGIMLADIPSTTRPFPYIGIVQWANLVEFQFDKTDKLTRYEFKRRGLSF
jgi:hypothetical protein